MSFLFELNPRNAMTIGLLVILALIPLYAALTGNTFVMTLFTRVLILAMTAVSLNLIMGYGGMVSFGHAAYLGLGGYAVGIWPRKASARVSSNGRWRLRSRRCSRSWSAR